MSRTLSDRERRVCDAIARREKALLDDLRLHVGIPTGGRNLAGLDESRERLTARAKALNADVQTVPGDPRPDWLYGEAPSGSPLPTAVCRRQWGGRPPSILICGHLDTVHDPRSGFRSLTLDPGGKRALGPGCADMKGGLVIGLAALEALEESGVGLPWTLLLNSDEETGSYHSAKTIRREAESIVKECGHAGALGIALESATGDDEGGLVTQRAGSGQFVIEALGKSAHVGRDFASGVSAVTALALTILRAQDLAAVRTAGSGEIIVNIGPLEGGSATNVVPARARAWGNVRFASARDEESLVARLQGLAGSTPTGARVEVRASIARPAKPATAPVMKLAALAREVSEALGRPLPFSTTAGVCDGNLMQAAGLPTLDTLGVRGGGLHTTDEWIDLPSLVDRCQLLAVFMMRATGTS